MDKISNELLSWVFGCECEFVCSRNGNIELTGVDLTTPNIFTTGSSLPPTENDLFRFGMHINLHTFIHLAKIKAFECGYIVNDDYEGVIVWTQKQYNDGGNAVDINDLGYKKDHECNPYNPIIVLEAFEWVAEKVGGSDG